MQNPGSPPGSPPRYAVVIPVKAPRVAKSRLSPLGDLARRRLVAAFAADTVVAARACPLVDVVAVSTDHLRLAADMRTVGAEVLSDGAASELNSALAQAATALCRRYPGRGVVALCADLPALRSEELTRALTAAPPSRASFVADAAGGGTTMLAAPRLQDFRPRFGAHSRLAHRASGALELLLGDVPTLRHDVDTPADLRAALSLGVGARTAEVCRDLRL